jgi:pimeloyl-ACP methyl ester carboxylesterase
VLDVGYVDVGPADDRHVVLLQGWPYDIHSYAQVAPALGAAGYRAIVPYLRGYGTTPFSRTQPSATASSRPWPST